MVGFSHEPAFFLSPARAGCLAGDCGGGGAGGDLRGFAGICGARGAALRIVSYNIDCSDQASDNNITGTTHSLPTLDQGIGLHHIGSNAQPVDVMSCEDLTSTTLSNFVAQLNAIYGAGTYAYDTTTDPNTGGGRTG